MIRTRRPLLVLVATATASLLAACGANRQQAATTTVAHRRTSFTAMVARAKSGILRIETSACDGRFIGTGFLLTPRLVATVEHVIDGAYSITLKQDGKVVGRGTVIGSDPSRDVALVRSSKAIRGYHFRLSSHTPVLGADVAALGFPLGLPLTLTRGSVSGLNRTIPINGIDRRKLVQTDAAVNPGNSGGPLMTNTGQVVGLIDLGTEQANGLAFAVSAKVAAPLLAAWRAAPQPASTPSCGGSAAQAAPAAPTTTQAQPGSYGGHDFSIEYPAGWAISHLNEGKNLDTTFTSPSQPTLLMRVDENPGPVNFTPAQAAAPVIRGLRRDPTYQEVGVTTVTFEGMDALQWEFEDTESGVRLHKVDLFFIDASGHGWGILVQAPQSVWAKDAGPFNSYVQTFIASG